MTKRDRVVLISAALLAALVITSVVLQVVSSKAWNQTSSFLFALGMVVVCLFSIALVYLRLIRKSKYEKQLNPDYYEVYQAVKDGLTNSELSRMDQREALSDILEMLNHAQAAGKAIHTVIPDGFVFVQRVIQAYTRRGRRGLFLLLDGCSVFTLFVLLVYTLLWLENPASGYFTQKIDVSLLFFLFTIAFLVLPLTKGLAARHSTWAYILPLGSGIALVGVLEILRHFFYSAPFVRWLLDHAIAMIPNAAILGCYLLFVLLLVFLKIAIRRRLANYRTEFKKD